MHIGVGSGNPVKRRAVESMFPDATVTAVSVDSGVSEQPFGHDETIRGAENRARTVLVADEVEADYGVGLEGGVAEFDGTDGLFVVMWAAVTDGDRVGHGAGPSLELPADIAARVRDGEELGPVMDDVLGTTDVAKKEGAAGALSGERIDREQALGTAVAGAFGPFATEFYASD
jgi:inosine/xanthosine triphosphatase